MKTKNQTEQAMLELAVTKAANEDGISPPGTRDVTQPQAWSPKEVWLTRVRAPTSFVGPEPGQI